MLKAWTVLLVCGLLPFSQGVVENVLSFVQLDKSVLENVLSQAMAQGDLLGGLGGGLTGGLLGGNGGGGDLVGSLTGGLTGGLLGGNGGGDLVGGLTGGLLGGNGGGGDLVGGLTGGLLGGNGGGGDLVGGLTGGLLGGNGGGGDLVGGLTGGLTGGLLGGKGGGGDLVGGLTGGLTGGLLGGNGGGGDLVGGLTGGLTGGLLGGNGGGGDLVGGLTGGLTGGLLGGNGGGGDLVGSLTGGLTGGLLGGNGGGLLGGLTGGLLGGEGGGLLGGVLGSQGGNKGGTGGGLLGNLLGGQGLLGLKIVDIILPKISLKLLEGVGVDLNIYTKVEVKTGNTPLLGLLNLNLLVEVNITGRARMVQDESGAPKLVIENCKTLLGGVQILSGQLPLNLDRVLTNLLNNLLPGLLCPVLDLVLNVVNLLLGTINSVCPFGMLGQLHYTLAGLPLFHGQHILLNLNLMITDPEGNTVHLPPVELPALPSPVPGDHSSQLVLPGELLTTLIGTVASKGLLNIDITQQTLRGNIPMTTAALQSLIPEISLLGAPSLPLVVRIRLNASPKVALQNGEVSVMLDASIGVFAHTRSGPKLLFEVEANIGLRGKITAGASKLSITLSLQSLNLKVTSSNIGSFNVAVLEGWIKNLLLSEYLPVINGVLEIGIPLPNLFNMKFDDAVVSVVQKGLVVGTAPKLF